MNRETKNIDKLFSDKLNGLKASVPAGAWNRMNKDLDLAKRKKVYFFSRLAAASVLLLLTFGAGFYYASFIQRNKDLSQEKSSDQQQEIVNPVENPPHSEIVLDIDKPEIESVVSNQNLTNKKISTDRNNKVENILASESTMVSTPIITSESNEIVAQNIPINENIEDHSTRQDVSLNTLASLKSNYLAVSARLFITIDTRKKQPIFTGIADPTLMNYGDSYADYNTSKPSDTQKWSVGGQFAPIYSFRDISTSYPNGQASTIAALEKKYNDTEDALMAYAGGVNIDYTVKGRWSVQSGIYFSRIGQTNNDALEFSLNNKQFTLIAIHTSTGDFNLDLSNVPPAIRSIQAPKDTVGNTDISPVSVIQKIDLFEIPFLLNYKLLDKKVALNFTGGLSPAYLVKNSTSLEYEGKNYDIGEASNLNNMVVNSSIGMGVAYSFTKQLSLSFQPTFKYALSPINSNTAFNYHPYSFSLFTGISYKF